MTSTPSLQPQAAAGAPVLSVVIALSADDPHLPELLASVPAAGDEGLALELVFAATRGAATEEADRWCIADERGRVVRDDSVDASGLRRAGLAVARGDWVLLARPDAVFDEGMLPALADHLARVPDGLDVVALNVQRLVTRTGERRDTHPGRWRFVSEEHVVDLVDSPEYLQVQLESVVIRKAALGRRAAALRPALSASDDPLVIAAVLADGERPLLGLAPEAIYFERVGSQVGAAEFAHFRAAAAHYLGRAELAASLVDGRATAPTWLAWAIIADAVAILRREVSTPRRATALSAGERERFITLSTTVLQACGHDAVAEYSVSAVPPETRDVLYFWASGTEPQRVRRAAVDARTGQAMIRYTFAGELPAEQFLDADGGDHPVAAGKIRKVDYFGQMRARERIAWVDAAVTAVILDGVRVDLDKTMAPPPSRGPRARRRSLRASVRAARRSWLSRAAAVRSVSRVPGGWRRFDDAWLLMDRADLAGDNAEHLYRWLAANRPHVNAWYVLREDSPDYPRLQAEGFRLLPYGSVAHQVALNRAVEYLSSHAGVDVLRPMGDRLVAREPTWRFTFLQHGVIHNDLSIWLNSQRFDLFVASTHDEYQGIIGDGSPYVFTAREVKLVGMPRHDSLRRLADAHPWQGRRTILIAPTWRNSLFLPASKPGERRIPRADFHESDYVTSIADILGDSRLRVIAEREGLEIVFLPHPNIGEHFPKERIPSYVRVTSYADENVQDLLADTRVFITDYSSVAFDAAFAEAAVVYLQTDDGSIFGGDHTLHPGYFRFEEHGFGPVCRSAADATAAVLEALASDDATATFRERAHATFAWWDANSCARLVEVLEAPVRSDPSSRFGSAPPPGNRAQSPADQ